VLTGFTLFVGEWRSYFFKQSDCDKREEMTDSYWLVYAIWRCNCGSSSEYSVAICWWLEQRRTHTTVSPEGRSAAILVSYRRTPAAYRTMSDIDGENCRMGDRLPQNIAANAQDTSKSSSNS
jgi:hypothetical protein